MSYSLVDHVGFLMGSEAKWTFFEHFGFPLPVIPGLPHTHLLPLEGVRLVITNEWVHLLSGTWA
jgi:hypothetical protein